MTLDEFQSYISMKNSLYELNRFIQTVLFYEIFHKKNKLPKYRQYFRYKSGEVPRTVKNKPLTTNNGGMKI
ncbi:MAG: hypothetical protein ACI4M3_03825 [Acutalibacteraceae bacterium]